jgi:hypothetical protein
VLHLVPRLTCRRTQSRRYEEQTARARLCIRRRPTDEFTAVEQLQRIIAFGSPYLKVVTIALSENQAASEYGRVSVGQRAIASREASQCSHQRGEGIRTSHARTVGLTSSLDRNAAQLNQSPHSLYRCSTFVSLATALRLFPLVFNAFFSEYVGERRARGLPASTDDWRRQPTGFHTTPYPTPACAVVQHRERVQRSRRAGSFERRPYLASIAQTRWQPPAAVLGV